MARIEQNFDQWQNQPAAYAPRKPRRKIRPKATCCLVFLFFVLVFFLIGLAALAKTGLVQIPFFSDVFYQIPQPSRVVEVDEAALADFQQGLDIQADQGVATLRLSEEELTYILRQLLASQKDQIFASNVQAVISEEGIEVFGLLLKPTKVNLTIDITPQLAQGKLTFALSRVKVGGLLAPTFLVNWLKSNFLDAKLAELNQQLSRAGQIQSFRLAEGYLEISGQLDLSGLKN
ncbi:MAG: hypothetical protein A2744_04065 [Candidatus Buchananbacteria bacterium RIFCSPHIGHO2_01_FULL_44_11]|uniref:DUF2993 domain-containing protein n=1 Tax=Candidatus Buchananbacteria bacterium RIFCSPHIGHO2_01_FULL_44_11 TaxID=1797535 RepID=A0A1G1Y1G3_9BACT|nr:MAG: hypothetical protein A2744_04065 [Candidatus Buchananbacteria bacterium RIFCSPHIGHO2_01_FULL_44_11]